METKHNFVQLAEAQRKQETLYCAGLDPHSFGSYKRNMEVYGFRDDGEVNGEVRKDRIFYFYLSLCEAAGVNVNESKKVAGLIAAIERYFCEVIRILIKQCNVRVFKPQFGLYIQLGPPGSFLLYRIREYISELEKTYGRIIIILDCKPGDIATTQAGYFLGYMGNLKDAWGIDYTPYGFDIINPTPWMGEDTMVLEEKGKQLIGLGLLRQGKGLIYVNKTSNPSGPQYQNLIVSDRDEGNNNHSIELIKGIGLKPTLALVNAADAYFLSQKYDLEIGGLSQLGLVIGATYPCDGSIRQVFPLYTGLNPGFGAQSKDKPPITPFQKVMLELIRQGEWNGQGCIFSSSRGALFPWEKSFEGSGDVNNLEGDLIAAVEFHRMIEHQAYELPKVKAAGIEYPF